MTDNSHSQIWISGQVICEYVCGLAMIIALVAGSTLCPVLVADSMHCCSSSMCWDSASAAY